MLTRLINRLKKTLHLLKKKLEIQKHKENYNKKPN